MHAPTCHDAPGGKTSGFWVLRSVKGGDRQMKAWRHIGWLVAIVILASTVVLGCGGGDDQSDPAEPAATTTQTDSAAQTDGAAQTETEVTGMPAGFPGDVPVHPGTVTAYDPMEVTESTTVHQLTVESMTSFDDVISWYESQLPEGWSVGFLEQEGEDGSREGKIALNGGDYAPASPDGRGGGVIVGVFEGDTTQIVTTVTVMGQ